MAKVLEKSRVIIVGSECPDLVAACKMLPAKNMEKTIQVGANVLGSACQLLIVPYAMLTLPVIGKRDQKYLI